LKTMKGLVSHPNGDLTLSEVPVPKIGENIYAPRDVLLEVQYCGICGSDIHRWKADKTGVKFPPRKVVSGHEIVGIVREVGPKVPTLSPEIGWFARLSPSIADIVRRVARDGITSATLCPPWKGGLTS